MNVNVFLSLLVGLSSISSLITNQAKRVLDEMNKTYSSTLLACGIAVLIGTIGTCMYYSIAKISDASIVVAILMGIACALSSTNGYDCVMKIAKQMLEMKEG